MDTSTTSPECIDVTAEETCPAPSIQVSGPDWIARQAPAVQTPCAPSAATFELMDQLEAMARDAARGEDASSDQPIEASPDQPIENVPEGLGLSPGLPAVGSSITVSPRPAGFENDPFASDRVSLGGRTSFILAGLFMAVLIGVGATLAWHSPYTPTVRPPEQSASVPAARVPASGTQTTAAPATPAPAPELARQLDVITQDLASVRRGIEELTAKQEQLAAKQEQMAQSVAKLQALEQSTRQKSVAAPARAASVPPLAGPSRAASIAPRASVEPAPPPAPRPALHPVPPMPVPQ